MCTYTSHIRICARCRSEDTVLISEQLCPVARASAGIFGSCLRGVLCVSDATGYVCWACREDVVSCAVVGRRKLRLPLGVVRRGGVGVAADSTTALKRQAGPSLAPLGACYAVT